MTTLGMLTIVVTDYDEAIRFYTQNLGFTLVEDTRMSDTKRWVVVAPDPNQGARMLLAVATSPSQHLAVGNQTGGRVGLFLYTQNFDETYQNFLDNNVNFTEDPRLEEFGKVVVFSDLYGNLWDLIERPHI
ncbi:MAG: VOC family protein [Actinobacteria bacterium]|uniref:Unannotated protein n=1 Tax=freshwater metagenome TaxID=449393 RepID=A0A6J5YI87_9ZZZZ|nr:VOC family protein [Actinomycetota bacterium]